MCLLWCVDLEKNQGGDTGQCAAPFRILAELMESKKSFSTSGHGVPMPSRQTKTDKHQRQLQRHFSCPPS